MDNFEENDEDGCNNEGNVVNLFKEKLIMQLKLIFSLSVIHIRINRIQIRRLITIISICAAVLIALVYLIFKIVRIIKNRQRRREMRKLLNQKIVFYKFT